MLDLHNILNKLIKWVNSIGQPKTIQNIKDVEVISAIKVKKNKVEPTPDPYKPIIVTGSTGSYWQPESNGVASNKYGIASTSHRGVNFYEFEANEVIPDDLKDLLGGGSNIAPVDINVMYNNTNRKATQPKLNKNKNKNKK